MYDAGTAQEYIVCSEEDVEVAPEHLSAIEGAALPLVGLTGWRAFVTKTGENASRGRNILITGCVSATFLFSDRSRLPRRVLGALFSIMSTDSYMARITAHATVH